MPQLEELKIFLASPSDVPKERDYVEEVVAELNDTVAGEQCDFVRSGQKQAIAKLIPPYK
jgi:hypothetical protein